ncbi:hypothetical protein [Georgenia sp. SUBG003]|uniref:hypothetical protein n=1 Tax=Georgenia sp. SUBG003 TaxID=1497974 RepID=UPI003AB1B41E
MADGEWRRSIFDFFTLDGAVALRDRLASWEGGRLVVHVTEMPIKCPVAPWSSRSSPTPSSRRGRCVRGSRSSTSPRSRGPHQTRRLRPPRSMLADRDIAVEPDFYVEHIDPGTRTLVSMDEREVPFDLLVTVPLNMGADYVVEVPDTADTARISAPVRRRKVRRPWPLNLRIGLSALVFVVAVLLLTPWLAPHDPAAQDLANRLAPTGAGHLLGTDHLVGTSSPG